MKDRDASRSATLAKGLEILNFISARSTPQRLREIMEGLDLTKPTAHRILSTLVDFGMVRYNKEAATYQLGMRFFEMSGRVWRDFDLRGAAAAEMSRLNELTGETVGLALLGDGHGILLDLIDGMHGDDPTNSNRTVALWNTAIGKALVAGIGHEARQKLLSSVTPDILSATRFATIDALAGHLDLVNARGYALEIEEDGTGQSGVGAPVVDHRGLTVAAMGLSSTGHRLSRERLHELGPSLIEATRRASLRAGGSPRPVSTVPRPSTPVTQGLSVAANTRCLIGESPIWDAERDRLYWVDICRPAIHVMECATGETRIWRSPEMVTSLALHSEGLLAACQSGIKVLSRDDGRTIRLLGDPHVPPRTNRFNDGKCDRRGRFWVGSLALNLKPEAGALYRIDGENRFSIMETGLTLPNGIGWSPDERTMYLVETAQRTVFAYDFDADTGSIANRRPFIVVPGHQSGSPDGLAVDSKGNLWVALWDGWRVAMYDSEGRQGREIVLPVPRPTSCTLAGPGGNLLYITSARIRIAEQLLLDAPQSGAVFQLNIG